MPEYQWSNEKKVIPKNHTCPWVSGYKVLFKELNEIKKALGLKSTQAVDIEKLRENTNAKTYEGKESKAST